MRDNDIMVPVELCVCSDFGYSLLMILLVTSLLQSTVAVDIKLKMT